jgi:hypothetical protein
MRSTGAMPAPRARRAGNVSPSSFAPLAFAMRLATASPLASRARPPTRSAAGSPERSAAAISSTTLPSTGAPAVDARGAGAPTAPPSDHDASAGRISVATEPGGPNAAATAATASAPTSAGDAVRRTQCDTLRATVSMSDSSCASYFLWNVAWSPTMLTIGTLPLRALCKFARPFPSPGPRCSNVAAGRPAMRAYPSAAPVATPSNSASTPRISGTASSAATKCISDVPGFVKHVSTPQSTSVRMSACAPFTCPPPRRRLRPG